MKIRRAEPKDIDDILRLLTQVNMVHHTIRPDLFNGPATKYAREELKEKIKVEQDPIFVLPGEDSHILGYIFCESQEVEESPLRTHIRTLYIDDLCVDETARRQHVGQQLYDYALDYARKHGYYNVTLHVWGGNDSALHFYQKMGMHSQYQCLAQIL
jgi:ribosomal protein S18 acetylase RimI-like enzyme